MGGTNMDDCPEMTLALFFGAHDSCTPAFAKRLVVAGGYSYIDFLFCVCLPLCAAARLVAAMGGTMTMTLLPANNNHFFYKEKEDSTRSLEELRTFLMECNKGAFLQRGGKKKQLLVPIQYDASKYWDLSRHDLQKILRHFGCHETTQGRKSTLVLALIEAYVSHLESNGMTKKQLKDLLLSVHGLKLPASARKAEMVRAVVEAAF
jgi:hypothetical protein